MPKQRQCSGCCASPKEQFCPGKRQCNRCCGPLEERPLPHKRQCTGCCASPEQQLPPHQRQCTGCCASPKEQLPPTKRQCTGSCAASKEQLPPCPRQSASLCKSYKVLVDWLPIDTRNSPIVWIIGGPGAGKSTQSKKIRDKYGFTHLSTGALLKAEAKRCTERRKCLQAILEEGDLVCNEIVLALLKEEMVKLAPTAKGFVIDGFPREQSQGEDFEKDIGPVTVIIYLEASSETLTDRLLNRAGCLRTCYNEEAVKLRLNTFFCNNKLVLNSINKHKLKTICAENCIDAIFCEIVAILDPIVDQSLQKCVEPTDFKLYPH